ncbi:unnamed protein product [Closterium sp. NIES-65]|nr:unnamed protein product [Closterium sp. NIES-65]
MGLTENGPSIAVVGVTGAVGQEFLQVLAQRDFPYSSLKMLASYRSAGKKFDFDGRTYTVEELTEESFKGVDIALFSAGGSISKKFGPAAVAEGTIVVDNSSAFRMTDGVPLVVPEGSGAADATTRPNPPPFNSPLFRFSALRTRISALRTRISALPTRISALPTRISTLPTRLPPPLTQVNPDAMAHIKLGGGGGSHAHIPPTPSPNAFPPFPPRPSPPQVNPDAMAHIKLGGGGAIIANPNCSTIICLVAVTPIHRRAKVRRWDRRW